MIRGFLHGNKGRRKCISCELSFDGIGLFIEEGAYTTLAAAVSILVVLTLSFSAVGAVWSLSRSGDVQTSADATALAGANVVSSYTTAARAIDASILSMSLAGLCLTGVGMIGLLIPGARVAAGNTIDTGVKMLRMRNEFAESASKGLQKVEASLPYLVAANSVNTCLGQNGDNMRYAGVAVAVPSSSASEFSALEGQKIDADALENQADALDDVAGKLEDAAEERAHANEAAWLCDCGREGMNMQERAASLSGLSAAENPDYASSITWNPNVALDRARAYYRWRYDNDTAVEPGDEGRADAAARHEFYGLALEYLEGAVVEEADGVCVARVRLLPKDAAEMSATRLYTDAIWPTTVSDDGLKLHYSLACTGAQEEETGPLVSLSAEGLQRCGYCEFSAANMGKVPAASTSISNGFEYHLRAFMLALEDYVNERNNELELERQTQSQAKNASNSFEDALATLASKRPRIAPPGRYGCVSTVISAAVDAPESLQTSFAELGELSCRGAVSAAVLAPDAATKENNLLSRFFSSFASGEEGGGAQGLVSDVMGLWGRLLVGYGDIQSSLNSALEGLTSKLNFFGLGKIGSWLNGAVDAAVKGLGIEPVDLSLMKPVLTDSANVLAHADNAALTDVQGALRKIPLGTTDPAALLQAIGAKAGDAIMNSSFTVAKIPLPSGKKIPLKIKLSDVVGGAS